MEYSEAEHAQALLHLQNRALESIALERDFSTVLDDLCVWIAELIPQAICSIMHLDDDQRVLSFGSGPCVPSEFADELDGLVPGELAGSCGAAVHTGEMALVGDTWTDDRWESLRPLARRFGVRSCWSVPIFSRDNMVLGSFAVSRPVVGLPTKRDLDLLRRAGHLAGIVLERDRSQRVLHRVQKLESLGILVGGLAHDFNNILGGMMANVGFALSLVPPDSQVAQCLEDISKATDRGAELTRQLLTYAGKHEQKKEVVHLASIVTDEVDLVSASISRKVKLSFDIAEGISAVEVDSAQVRQVVMNLIINASEAFEGGSGEIGVCVRSIDKDGQEMIRLQVRDDGVGMSKETRDKVFDPFFTTKLAGRGLGLAAVQGIVSSQGGSIDVQSTQGVGTVFTVDLPATNLPLSRPPKLRDFRTQAAAKKGTILVVDDDAAIRNAARRILEGADMRVLTASDGSEAVELYEHRGSEIDAVLLDLSMPALDGRQVFCRLAEMNQNVRVVLSSGHSAVDALDGFDEGELSGVIAKPYLPARLIDVVSQALDA